MSRTAFHVGDELLLADILKGAEARAEADAELERASRSGDGEAAAKAVRRAVKARKAEASELRYSQDLDGAMRARELLEEAEWLVEEELAKARADADGAAEVLLLLALGELNCRHRSFTQRTVAMQAIELAIELARETQDRRSQADAMVLKSLALHDVQGETALRSATEAVPIFHGLGNKKCEAQAWHFVGMSRWQIQLRTQGLRAMAEAVRLFEEAEAPRHLALEHFAMADLSCEPRRFRSAQASAGHALSKLEQLGYGRGFATNALRCKLTADKVDNAPTVQVDALEAIEDMSGRGDSKAALDVKQVLVLAYTQERRFELAVQLVDEMLADVRDCQDPEWEMLVLRLLASVHVARLDVDQAANCLAQARALAQADGDDLWEWNALEEWAGVLYERKESAAAIAVLKEQQELVARTGDKMRDGMRLLRLCLVWGGLDHPCSQSNQMAWECAHEAQAIFEELGETRAEASAWDKMAQSHIICFEDKAMEVEKALAAAERGRALHKQRGDVEREALMLARVFKRIFTDCGRHEEATSACVQAVKMARSVGDKWLLANLLDFLVKLRLDQLNGEGESGPILQGKDARKASRRIVAEAREALESALESGDRQMVGHMALQRAVVALMEGDDRTAARMVAKAAAIGLESYDLSLQGAAALWAARLSWYRGNVEEATCEAQKALALAQSIEHDELHHAVCVFLQEIEGTLRGDGDEEPPEGFEQQPQDFEVPPEDNNFPKPEEEESPLPAPDTPLVPRPQRAPGPAALVEEAPVPAAAPRVGVLRGRRVDRVSLMKIVSETAMGNMGLDLVDYDTPLLEAGILDSLRALTLKNQLRMLTGFDLPSSLVYDYPSQHSIVNLLVDMGNRREAEGQNTAPHPGPAPAVMSPGMTMDQVLG